jgi:pyrimidine operon attenuation protein/uracil phosphoribosyltransferase
MSEPRTLILNEQQVLQKIKRMAYQICEHNLKENHLVVVGIYQQGYHLAELLSHELKQVAPFEVLLARLDLDKQKPLSSKISLDIPETSLDQKAIVLVDDVLNTGKTMAYSLKPFLNRNLKKLETAVLVNRSHKRFPISANYQGIELATTLSEHIIVVLDKKQKFAALQ